MEHALLENKVKFQNLGLAVIDEHAFFGVEAASCGKNTDSASCFSNDRRLQFLAHLAMSLYGDLDISVIDELPWKETAKTGTYIVLLT
jgi:ATP-dependent DNA helicase RecG